MAGWTAASLFPSSLLRDALNPQVKPGQVLTPEEKLRLSGGVTRQALGTTTTPASTIKVPKSTGGDVAGRTGSNVLTPVATSGANSATSVPAATNQPTTGNMPPFLQGNQNLPTQADALATLQELIGAMQPKQDPDLIKAQTILAQQQAMSVARQNEAARQREAAQGAMSYLQSQMKDAAKYTTGSVGNILMNKYADRAKVLQRDGELNWLNMPSSSFSVPRNSGWRGPAMPGTWSI